MEPTISETAAEAVVEVPSQTVVETTPAAHAAAPTEAPATVVPQGKSLKEHLTGMSPEQLDAAMLAMDNGAPVVAEQPASQLTSVPVQTQSTEQQPTNPAPPAQPAEHEPGPKEPKRINVSYIANAEERAQVIEANDMVRRNPDLTFAEALAEVGFKFPTKAAEAAPVTEQPKPQAQSDELSTAQSKLADLDQKYADAERAFDAEAKAALIGEIRQTERQILRLETRAEQASQQTAVQQKAQSDAEFDRLKTVSPDFDTPGTALFDTALQIYREEEARNPGFLLKPGAHTDLFARAHARAGIAMPALNGKPAVKTSAPVQTPERTPAKPAVSAAALATGRGSQDAGTIVAKFSNPVSARAASDDELDAILNSVR